MHISERPPPWCWARGCPNARRIQVDLDGRAIWLCAAHYRVAFKVLPRA